jgi:acetoacetate decarboxylase
MAKTRARRTAPASYSMPELSGLYGQPPFEYRDAHQLLVMFRTEPRVLKRLIPAPLQPDAQGRMFVTVSHFFTSGFGHYYEAGVVGLAQFERRPVNYSLYLLLDNDIAIAGGREIWGFPKKLGRVALDERDGVLRGTTERGGITLLDCALQLAQFGSPDEITSGSPEYVCRKLLPSVVAHAPPEVFQLTSTTLTNIVVREVNKGPATLAFATSPADRIVDIPIVEVMGGYYFRTDFTLGDGTIIHDYLA